MADERSVMGRPPDDRKPPPQPRAVSGEEQSGEPKLDHALRPRSLQEMIGQDQLREKMLILVEAARRREETLDHVLLYGPPGLGKCITSDSFILTSNGLQQFQDLLPVNLAKDSYQTSRVEVFGLHGLESTSHVYANGVGRTLRIRTRSGFEIEGSPNHPLLVATETGPQWTPIERLSSSNFVAIAKGTNVWGEAQSVQWQGATATDRRQRTEATIIHYHTQLTETLGRSPTITELRHVYSRGISRNPVPEITAKRLGLPLSDGRKIEQVSSLWTQIVDAEITDERTVTLDADLAYLLGVLVGDGHFERGDGHPAFVITCGEQEMQVMLQRVCENHFGRLPQVRQYGRKTAQLRFSQSIGQVMLAFGALAVTAADKVVPAAVLQGPSTVAVGFLQGLFDADGSVWPDGYIEFGTRSRLLSAQVQLLLLNLGIVAHRTRKQRAGSAFWCLFIGGRDAERFHDLVGCRLTRKRMRAEQVNARPRGWSRDEQIEQYLNALPAWVRSEPEFAMLTSLALPNIYWDQVSAVEESTAATFDFVVPGAHSFVANGFFNHNTTLSHILANEMSGNLKVTAGPAIEKAGDLAAILTNLRKGDILFIDEIHRLRTVVEEILYPAMEDFALDIVVGSGPGARNIRLNLPKFTIVGATTRLASITAPLRARFGVVERFDFYEPAAIEKIVTRAAQLLDVQIEPDAAQELSRRSRGTPRVGLRLLRRVRDFALVRADGRINLPVAEEALSMMLQIDWLGLDDLDRRVLEALIIKFNGGPVGLDTLAASISEEADTIMDVVEPYLLQLGFLDRTPRGRIATRGAYNHLGIPYPERPEQPGLFGLPKANGNG